MSGTAYLCPVIEAIGFHGCRRWDLPKSPGSYVTLFEPYPNLPILECFYRGSSNGLVLIEVSIDPTENMGHDYKSFVGNPVLQQWLQIPEPPEPCTTATGLVTRLEEDGVVSSFKVVRTCESEESDTYEWRVYVYSSDSGLWSFKNLLSRFPIYNPYCCSSMSFKGMIYLLETGSYSNVPDVLIAHDFCSDEEAGDGQCCRVIHFPLPRNKLVRRCLTTSGGNVIYIEVLNRKLKLWRLKDNNNNSSGSSEWWQLLREEIHMASVGFDVDCFPLAMNLFDLDIVYLWSRQDGCFVSGNLERQEFIVHQESENWSSSEGCYRFNTHDCKGYMKGVYDASKVLMLSQFVLPQWMDSVPTIRQIDHLS